MESPVGVTCAFLLLACVQIQAQYPMMAGMGGMGGMGGVGAGGQPAFSRMAAFMGFQSCDPWAPPPPPPRGGPRGAAPGGRAGPGGQAGMGGRSPAMNFGSMMMGMHFDVPDAPDFPAMPFPGPNGRMQWTGCFCQSLEMGGFGSGECMGMLTGNLRNDQCMQAGLCCTCDYGFKRR